MRALDALLQQGVEDGAVAGVVAIAAAPDGLVYEGASGIAAAATAPPMTADTVLWLMSLSKILTSTACMQLVEQGDIRLDQPAGEILPGLASPLVLEGFADGETPVLRPARRPITVRHLLTHTSGFSYAIWNAQLARYLQLTGIPDIGTCLDAAFQAPLLFDPGDRWEYGISTDWVGKLVEARSGKSLEDYLKTNILIPLDMRDTGFILDEGQKKRLAGVFSRQSDGSLVPVAFQIPQAPEFFMGGGGLFGTPRDFMRFLRALLNGGALDGARILRAETVALMLSNQIGDLNVRPMQSVSPEYSQDFDLFPGQIHKWGLGFDINPFPGPDGRSAGSGAWAGLLNCHFWIDPARNLASGFFTQTLPFFDPAVMSLHRRFERTLCQTVT